MSGLALSFLCLDGGGPSRTPELSASFRCLEAVRGRQLKRWFGGAMSKRGQAIDTKTAGDPLRSTNPAGGGLVGDECFLSLRPRPAARRSEDAAQNGQSFHGPQYLHLRDLDRRYFDDPAGCRRFPRGPCHEHRDEFP